MSEWKVGTVGHGKKGIDITEVFKKISIMRKEIINEYTKIERRLRLGHQPEEVDEIDRKRQKELMESVDNLYKKELLRIKEHDCIFDDSSYCLICRLDGHA